MKDGYTSSNPWKTGALAVGGAVILLAGASAVIAMNYGDDATVVAKSEAKMQAPQSQIAEPAAVRHAVAPREDCQRYLAGSTRDNTGIVKDSLVGGAIGAGLGAAGGAIADGGKGAAKGAGIGGLIGGVAGALSSNEQERERVESARAEYDRCLVRNG